MSLELPAIMAASKTFPSRPKWVERDADWLHCVSALDIDGVTIEGLRFRATALKRRLDESVTFQVEYSVQKRTGPRGGPLARIEWRPLSSHNNKQVGPKELQNVLQNGSHYHEFSMNWDHSPSQVRNGHLCLSRPLQTELRFDEIVAFVSEEFRISPADWITQPDQWQTSGLV